MSFLKKLFGSRPKEVNYQETFGGLVFIIFGPCSASDRAAVATGIAKSAAQCGGRITVRRDFAEIVRQPEFPRPAETVKCFMQFLSDSVTKPGTNAQTEAQAFAKHFLASLYEALGRDNFPSTSMPKIDLKISASDWSIICYFQWEGVTGDEISRFGAVVTNVYSELRSVTS